MSVTPLCVCCFTLSTKSVVCVLKYKPDVQLWMALFNELVFSPIAG